MPRKETCPSEDVIILLHEIGERLKLQGDNRFRAQAYTRAAESLRALTRPLVEVIAAGELTSIPGVGSAIAGVIERLHNTGSHSILEKLRKDIPHGVLEMLSIPGIRTSQILRLHKETGISTVEALQHAIEHREPEGTKAFSPAFRHKVLQGLKMRREGVEKKHIHRATPLLEEAQKNLSRTHPHMRQVTLAGDVRRQCELVADLSLVAILDRGKPPKPMPNNIQIHCCEENSFGAALLFATGSPGHIRSLVTLAKTKNLTLTPEGLKKGRKVIASKTEEEIYGALGLDVIPPELREGHGEIQRAKQRTLPCLVTGDDIQGILHAHTVRSDGANTLKDMAEGTRARGFSYLGITDHSQSAHYAGGLKAVEVTEQREEANVLNRAYGRNFHIFRGIESDILADGELDYPDAVLKRFDFIIASIHSRFKMDREMQTARIIRAVKNPYTTILGHMTGRQLLRRPGYDVDVEAILKACAKYGVAVEINAHPWRLDCDWRWHQTAMKFGCMMSINPDAHSIAEIDNLRWGVAMARKGGIPPHRVINCLSAPQFQRFISAKRSKANQ